jgi:hypothetical protein
MSVRCAILGGQTWVTEAMMLKLFFLLVSLTFLCGAAAGITIAYPPGHIDETSGYGAPS